MKKRLIISLLSAGLAISSISAHAQTKQATMEQIQSLCADVVSSSKPHKITLDEARKILKNEGFTLGARDENSLTIKHNGRKLMLYRMNDGDLQLYYGASGVKITPKQVNEWNRTKRLSRAYIDRVGDPVLESDLLTDGGITPQNFLAFVKTFANVSVPAYRSFLIEKGR